MRILCVAEKPSISKSVAATLAGGRPTVRNSKNKYIKNYDFTFNFPQYGVCNVTMTAVLGHLTSLDFPKKYKWGACDPVALFDAEVISDVTKGSRDVVSNITEEAKTADLLMIWTDCDREGEYIGFEILEYARKQNNRLNIDNVLRAQFSHLESSHIVYAANNPGRLNKGAIDAVRTRSELDLRTGASFTRLLTDTYKSNSRVGLDKDKFISYGSCQFPTLGFIVDRYKRVKGFISESFWTIDIEIKKKTVAKFNWARGHVFDRVYGTLVYENCLESDNALIEDLKTKPTKNYKPLPLTTVELQKNCSKFFKMSGKVALDAAEKLYNKGFVSYPRTETDIFPKTMDLNSLIDKQVVSDKWGDYATELNNGKFRQPRAGSHDDKAHPPIHPICFVNTSTGDLNENEKKVYEYITRHFLACCSEDALGSQTTVTCNWGGEIFNAHGLVVLERNYLDVYPYRKWETSKMLPAFEKGESVSLFKTELKEGKTSPPSYMTESELITLMDSNGIGTDATIAEHIATVVKREYVLKEPQGRGQPVFIPTELGWALVEGFDRIGLNNMSLSKPFLRKDLEEDLKGIVDGIAQREEKLFANLSKYKQAYNVTSQQRRKLTETYLEVKANGNSNP